MLSACARRICQQHTFDGKSLGVGVCYGCGHVLFTSVDNIHTYLIDKPSGLREDDPASAYLKAVPNCTLTFVYTERGNSTRERWYSCSNCTNSCIPQDQHVGKIMEISVLKNKYERGQVALCGLFSNTVRQAGISQYSHIQGEVNSKLLDDLNIPLEKVLEDEAAGLAFPLDAKYFDQLPLMFND